MSHTSLQYLSPTSIYLGVNICLLMLYMFVCEWEVTTKGCTSQHLFKKESFFCPCKYFSWIISFFFSTVFQIYYTGICAFGPEISASSGSPLHETKDCDVISQRWGVLKVCHAAEMEVVGESVLRPGFLKWRETGCTYRAIATSARSC